MFDEFLKENNKNAVEAIKMYDSASTIIIIDLSYNHIAERYYVL